MFSVAFPDNPPVPCPFPMEVVAKVTESIPMRANKNMNPMHGVGMRQSSMVQLAQAMAQVAQGMHTRQSFPPPVGANHSILAPDQVAFHAGSACLGAGARPAVTVAGIGDDPRACCAACPCRARGDAGCKEGGAAAAGAGQG